MKKNQPKKVNENFSKTTTDNFNMTLIKGFADNQAAQRRGGPPMGPKDRKLNMSKTQKNFVVNRYRSHKDISKDNKYYYQHAPPPPLGKTFGHGLFKHPSQPKL